MAFNNQAATVATGPQSRVTGGLLPVGFRLHGTVK
jgi:hypothetical protein